MAHRVTATLDDDTFERLKYWADKKELSVNEYLRDAVNQAIRFENKDYDLPELEIQRLNQLVDTMVVLSQNVKSLEDITVSGFDSLLSLTRGDNYLLEEEDGDI